MEGLRSPAEDFPSDDERAEVARILWALEDDVIFSQPAFPCLLMGSNPSASVGAPSGCALLLDDLQGTILSRVLVVGHRWRMDLGGMSVFLVSRVQLGGLRWRSDLHS
ncbi:unnamed protein product [Calypogeia fissa]